MEVYSPLVAGMTIEPSPRRIELPYRFTPREYQKPLWRAIVEQGKKRAVCVWHRRAGKDKTFLNILVAKAMETMGNYAYYFPTATLGRKALWDNIDANSGMRVIDHLPPQILAKSNEQQMKLTLVNGSTIQVLGTETLDVVGGNPIGVIFSETAQHRPDAWDYIRPILAENGGWAIFNGTPRGRNWFHKLLLNAEQDPSWFAQRLTVEDTGAISQEDIEAERRAGMSEDMIRQEFYCDFNAANPGAIYARLVEQARQSGRIKDIPIADVLVHTSWDLGSPANTTVWYWQVVGAEIRVIDCDVGLPFETLTARISHMMKKDYNYGTHFLPHDAAQTERSGKTFVSEIQAAGLKNVRVLPVCVDIWLGINGLKGLFPAMSFHSERCAKGLDALEAYRTKEVEIGKIISSQPVHDWSSHTADALRYMAEAIQAGMVKVGAAVHRRSWDGDEDFERSQKKRAAARWY
jgi:phage terminase large subunit